MTTTTTDQEFKHYVDRLLGKVPDDGLETVARGVWRTAIELVLRECNRFIHIDVVQNWISTVLFAVASDLYAQSKEASQHKTDLVVTPPILCNMLENQITGMLLYNDDMVRKLVHQQRYLLTKDLTVLLIEPPVIVNKSLCTQLEKKYPGILTAADVIKTLHEDKASRDHALRDWLARPKIEDRVNLEELGALDAP